MTAQTTALKPSGELRSLDRLDDQGLRAATLVRFNIATPADSLCDAAALFLHPSDDAECEDEPTSNEGSAPAPDNAQCGNFGNSGNNAGGNDGRNGGSRYLLTCSGKLGVYSLPVTGSSPAPDSLFATDTLLPLVMCCTSWGAPMDCKIQCWLLMATHSFPAACMDSLQVPEVCPPMLAR